MPYPARVDVETQVNIAADQLPVIGNGFMRLIFLLTIILLSSCENKKDAIVARQQAIKKEMEQVKAFYYEKLDSLESVKEADTNSAKQIEVAEGLVLTGEKKSVVLIRLQKEYDSLEVELQ